MRKPCLGCGTPTRGSRCPACARRSPYQQPSWRRLSRRVTAAAGACAYCGTTARLTAHHVIPRTEGGPDTPENLLVLCVSCHNRAERR